MSERVQPGVTADDPTICGETEISPGETGGSAPCAAFVVEQSDEPPRSFFVQDDTLLGRGRGVHLLLNAPTISRRHALIVITGEGCVLEDLLSDNGCFVNGKRIERAVLHYGDVLELGSFLVHYLGMDPSEQLWKGEPCNAMPSFEAHVQQSSGATTLHIGSDLAELRNDPRLFAKREQWTQRLKHGWVHCATTGELYKPGDQRFLMGGRDGIQVEGWGAAAEIVWSGSHHLLRRCGKLPRMKVNGRSVAEHMLMDDDRIIVGRSHFRYTIGRPDDEVGS